MKAREVTWNSDYSMLYFDNPVSVFIVVCVAVCFFVRSIVYLLLVLICFIFVLFILVVFTIPLGFQVGTGYSFTKEDAGYSTNEVEVGMNLYLLVEWCSVAGTALELPSISL